LKKAQKQLKCLFRQSKKLLHKKPYQGRGAGSIAFCVAAAAVALLAKKNKSDKVSNLRGLCHEILMGQILVSVDIS